MKLRLLTLFLITANLGFSGITLASDTYKSPVDINKKPDAVKRQFKAITLDNKLEVMLISDPDVKQSAAALNVNVGFGEDPKGQEGMAHFLEHMLFLGTKKYPDEGEYSRFINSHQGSNNAYTTFDNTNYFLNVNHNGFEGALDRFSQFFTAPLFTPKFVDREKNAVNNEFEKNRQNDGWRLYELAKKDIRSSHAAKKFGTGNTKTLSSITRKDLMAWHKKYYSANAMTMALVSPLKLNQLEALAKKYFTAIPNTKAKALDYSSNVLYTTRKPSVVHVQPVKDHKKLTVNFYLPPQTKNYRNKSYHILSDLLAAEHKGGLSHTVKSKGWASALYGGGSSHPHQYELSINISLTDKGSKEYKKVIQEIFSYIDFIKEKGFPKRAYYEFKALAEIYYVYPKFQEGGSYAAQMASMLQIYGGKDLLKKAYLFSEMSEKAFTDLLADLTIKNAQIIHSHKNFKPTKTEAIYGAKYKEEILDSSFVNSLGKKNKASKYQYPKANPYIPEDLKLIKGSNKKPLAISNSSHMKLWFQSDSTIGLPRANYQGRLIYEQPSKSPRDYVLNQIYNKVLSAELAEWQEQLGQAGIILHAGAHYSGMYFSLDGFSDKLPAAMADFLANLKSIKFKKQLFKDQKAAYLKDLQNIAFNSAYQQAMAKLKAEMNQYSPYVANHFKEAKSITFKEIQVYHKKFLANAAVQAVAYGNLKPEDVKASFKSLNRKTKSNGKFIDKAYLEGKKAPKSVTMGTKDNNDAWTSVRFIGERGPRNEAFASILSTVLSDKYFNDLRTHQQLGYVVATFPYRDPKNVGMQFLIQSSSFAPKELSKRTSTWLKNEQKRVMNLPDDEYKKIKSGILERLKKPLKTSDSFASRLYQETFILKKSGYRKELIKAVESMSAQKFKKIFKSFNNAEGQSIAVYVNKAS